jgi:catechol 2,3-dioxygenase-like lactoylglutathione lyase family enzyme
MKLERLDHLVLTVRDIEATCDFYVRVLGMRKIVFRMTDLDPYPVTAAAVAIGVLMLAFGEWQMRRMAAWIPLTFALSLVVGSIGTFVAGASALFILSGILFGSAFAAMAITAL